MIIKHGNGSTDTDKLPDADSMVLEKVEELRKICKQLNRTMFLVADVNKNNVVFWHTIGDDTNEKIGNLVSILDHCLKNVSNNCIRVAYKNSEEKFVIPGEQL